MKYPKEYLDEIKTRLKVSSVVTKTVSLKKRGKEFVGLSPFKNEKTPSFTVNDEKGFYHCFSTGEHGNIFDFLMKTQNFKFGEAVKTLANLAGMRPYTFSKEDEIRERKFKEYLKIILKYVSICHQNVIEKKFPKVNNYLKLREIDFNILTKFQIGYSDFNHSLLDLLKQEFSEEAILETGLFYFDEKKKIYIERFRNRLIFPINNISGNPIAIGGRILEKKDYLAKYINSPETQFFKKGYNLYNLDFARKLSNKFDEVYIVEGYMDVIGLSKNGVENVVANLGTALTKRQMDTINQFFSHCIICFDGDLSGYNAALRAAENFIITLSPEKKISFLFLPENEDPDSFIKRNGQKKFLKYSSDTIIPIHEFIFQNYKKTVGDDPLSQARFEKKLKQISNSIEDNYVKKYISEFFLKKISDLTPNLAFKKNKKYKPIQKSLEITQKYYNDTKSLSSIQIKEISLLYLIVKNLRFFKKNLILLDNIKFISEEYIVVFEYLIKHIQNSENLELKDIDVDSQLIEKIFKFAPIKYILEKDQLNDQKIIDLVLEIKRDLKNLELEARIEELESKFSKDFNENTFNELKELKKLQKLN